MPNPQKPHLKAQTDPAPAAEQSAEPAAGAATAGRDWRIRWGAAFSVFYLLCLAAYLASRYGWSGLLAFDAETLGSFLEGAFAPLAFLWLVIGYFLQQRELEQNTQVMRLQAREIRRSAEQAIIQSEKMAANEHHSGQQAFLQLAELVRRQLGSVAGLLFISSQGATGDGTVDREEISKLFGRMSAEDPEIFSRRLLERHLQIDDTAEQLKLFYGTPVRARHSNHFISAFEQLLQRAALVDDQQMLRDALMASGHGLLYGILTRHRAAAPQDLADIVQTGGHIDSSAF